MLKVLTGHTFLDSYGTRASGLHPEALAPCSLLRLGRRPVDYTRAARRRSPVSLNQLQLRHSCHTLCNDPRITVTTARRHAPMTIIIITINLLWDLEIPLIKS